MQCSSSCSAHHHRVAVSSPRCSCKPALSPPWIAAAAVVGVSPVSKSFLFGWVVFCGLVFFFPPISGFSWHPQPVGNQAAARVSLQCKGRCRRALSTSGSGMDPSPRAPGTPAATQPFADLPSLLAGGRGRETRARRLPGEQSEDCDFCGVRSCCLTPSAAHPCGMLWFTPCLGQPRPPSLEPSVWRGSHGG